VREVFAPVDHPLDPGRVFYTIRAEDINKRTIQTEIGPIHVFEFIGYVMRQDVGKRLYRVPNNEGNCWFWQMENDAQYLARKAGN
jgi:hypothetical protein